MKNLFISFEFEKYFQEYPFVMVDIGARGGIPKSWGALSKYLKVIGFEPDKQEYIKLSGRKNQEYHTKYLDIALSDEKKSIKFHVTKGAWLSSVFYPNQTLLDKFSKTWGESLTTIELEADTLDNQLKENQINDVDLIKLDTQGSELLILKGSTGVFNNQVIGVESEIEFVDVYKDQPLFSEVDLFLRKYRFHLMEIIRSKYWKRPVDNKFVRSRGQIMYGDVLYLKEVDAFFEMISGIHDESFKKAKILKALVMSILYEHMDYGFEIIQRAIQGGLFNEKEKQLLRDYINKQKRIDLIAEFLNKLPEFRGKIRLFIILYYLRNLFRKKENRWANGAIWR